MLCVRAAQTSHVEVSVSRNKSVILEVIYSNYMQFHGTNTTSIDIVYRESASAALSVTNKQINIILAYVILKIHNDTKNSVCSVLSIFLTNNFFVANAVVKSKQSTLSI